MLRSFSRLLDNLGHSGIRVISHGHPKESWSLQAVQEVTEESLDSWENNGVFSKKKNK